MATKRLIFAVLFFVTVFLPVMLFAQQDKPENSDPQKFALIIGNGAYTGLGRLANPVNDANDMAAALRELRFGVEILLDGSLEQMENAVLRLRDRLSGSKNSYGFFFYAGHGVQSGGENYLIPADANIPNENRLKDRAVSVQTILDDLNEAGNKLNVVVLDACRDNPFGWSRSGSRGLAVTGHQHADSIIVYATGAGQKAGDGTGRNGLFTGQLLKNIKTPGLEVKDMFNRTGADVSEVSDRQQIPAIYNQFFGTAYLGVTPSFFEVGESNVATGALEIITATAGTVQIIGAAVNQSVELPAWGHLPVNKINAGSYRVVMYYQDGSTEEKMVEVGRSESAKLEFSYRPVPPPSPRARKAFDSSAANLWTVGASIGSSFAVPWLTGTIHGTMAPFRYSFLELGLDTGLVAGEADAGYRSLCPFFHYAFFLPFEKSGGWYAGAGGGWIVSRYTFPEGEVPLNYPVAAITAGFNLLNMLDISWTLRTNFRGAINKVSVGYTYRFE